MNNGSLLGDSQWGFSSCRGVFALVSDCKTRSRSGRSGRQSEGLGNQTTDEIEPTESGKAGRLSLDRQIVLHDGMASPNHGDGFRYSLILSLNAQHQRRNREDSQHP